MASSVALVAKPSRRPRHRAQHAHGVLAEAHHRVPVVRIVRCSSPPARPLVDDGEGRDVVEERVTVKSREGSSSACRTCCPSDQGVALVGAPACGTWRPLHLLPKRTWQSRKRRPITNSCGRALDGLGVGRGADVEVLGLRASSIRGPRPPPGSLETCFLEAVEDLQAGVESLRETVCCGRVKMRRPCWSAARLQNRIIARLGNPLQTPRRRLAGRGSARPAGTGRHHERGNGRRGRARIPAVRRSAPQEKQLPPLQLGYGEAPGRLDVLERRSSNTRAPATPLTARDSSAHVLEAGAPRAG